jgi:hypothetical protein
LKRFPLFYATAADKFVYLTAYIGLVSGVEHSEEVIRPARKRFALVTMADEIETGEFPADFENSRFVYLADKHRIGDKAQLMMIDHGTDSVNYAAIEQKR